MVIEKNKEPRTKFVIFMVFVEDNNLCHTFELLGNQDINAFQTPTYVVVPWIISTGLVFQLKTNRLFISQIFNVVNGLSSSKFGPLFSLMGFVLTKPHYKRAFDSSGVCVATIPT